MTEEYKIFLRIKNKIHKVLPDAKVFLFGSRANGNVHEESDWDILILLQKTPDKIIKNLIHETVFPISLEIGAHISTIIVSEDDWNNNPSYYALHQSVSQKVIIA